MPLSHKPEDNLYLLAFIDVVDRLDILLLEIRHLQQSIIYALRAPTLYLPLRYEESYLFGEDWHKALIQGDGICHDIELLRKWVIRYPTPNAAVRTYSNLEQENSEQENISLADKIKHRLKKRIGRIWLGDNWARDQRLQYHSLYALQLLKQRVLRDKIALYRGALKANLVESSWKIEHTELLSKPAFMILRQGVLWQAKRYIAILRNHKQQVSQSVDFGMPTDPHPSTERRREMGIFMDFLTNRTHDIQCDILSLVKSYNPHHKDEDDSNVLMFHGWSQNTRVTNTHLFDKTNYHYNKYKLGNKKDRQNLGYINTSFWAPDRPDLHPVIAYEIAESVIKNTLGGFDDVALSNSDDDFTELLINIKQKLLDTAEDNDHLHFIKDNINDYVQSIGGDLLAASVKGVSYLYSLFLLRLTSGLYKQLKVGSYIKLDMVYSLKEGTASFDHLLQSYLRICLTTDWIKSTLSTPPSSLDNIVLSGAKNTANQLLKFLDQHAPAIRVKRAKYWIDLVNDLGNIIRQSNAQRTTKAWREDRDNDDWKKTGDLECRGERRFPRSTKSLNIRLQNYLFREVLAGKRGKDKPLYGVDDKYLEDKFKFIYDLEIKKVDIPNMAEHSYRHPPCLFRHMYDIPYQSSIIRSIDILHEFNTLPEKLFSKMHWDMELGRGLFAVALEFHMREAESPAHRLSLCINQLSYLHFSMEGLIFRNKIRDWLSCEDIKFIDYEQSISQRIKFLTQKRVNRIADKIEHLGATQINACFSMFKPINSEVIRRLEELAGHKLCQLLRLLSHHIHQIEDDTSRSVLHSLIQFLSIRRNNGQKQGNARSYFYNHMLAALGDIPVKDKIAYEKSNKTNQRILSKYLPINAPSVMIDRLSVTNLYPVPDPLDLKNDPYHNQNGMPFGEILQKNHWKTQYQNEAGKKHIEKNNWITLGRFDGISMIEVRLPCKCYLQSFTPKAILPHKDDDALLNETFPPHFSRREIARPVVIYDDAHNDMSIHKNMMTEMENHLFSMIVVTLQRRSMRLDFLFRMIRAINKEELEHTSALEEKIIHLKNQGILVIAFLTDGWGDMLFTFRKRTPLSAEDIEIIFDFQKAIYEDFMVDRTEILFTPKCLDYALANPNKYRITIQTRMMEDRWLEAGIHNYTDKLRKLCENPPNDIISKVDITLTPGRNDFSFLFTGVEAKKVSSGSYEKLIRWLNGQLTADGQEKSEEQANKDSAMIMLGHLETYIERLLIPKNEKAEGKER